MCKVMALILFIRHDSLSSIKDFSLSYYPKARLAKHLTNRKFAKKNKKNPEKYFLEPDN